MATDRPLSLNFRLSEFPGWREATEEEVSRLEELVGAFLQPLRRAKGRIRPTSWIRRSSSGAHASADAVDFLTLDVTHQEAWAWAAMNLTGTFGELILEPDNRSTGGGGAHIHVTRWPVGGFSEVFVERGEGDYRHGASMPSTVALLVVVGIAVAVALAVAGSP